MQSSSTLVTWCKEPTHWKRLWCWEGLRAGGKGDDRGWDAWMASLTRWTWVWMNSGSWWWTGRPGVLWFMGLQRVGHDWASELTARYYHSRGWRNGGSWRESHSRASIQTQISAPPSPYSSFLQSLSSCINSKTGGSETSETEDASPQVIQVQKLKNNIVSNKPNPEMLSGT